VGLYDTLQANKEELVQFIEGESDLEEEDEEGEGTIREEIEITRIEAPRSPSGNGPRQDIWDPTRGDDNSNEQTEDGIMRDLEWVEYDTMQHNSIQVAYQTDNDTINTCR